MRLNKWQTVEEMIAHYMPNICRVKLPPADFIQPDEFMKADIPVQYPTHLLYSTKTGKLLMLLSVSGIGTDNGYIVGANCYGDSNHDLDPREVVSIFQRAYDREKP